MSPEEIMVKIYEEGISWRQLESRAEIAGSFAAANCFGLHASAIEGLYDCLQFEMNAEVKQEARSHGDSISNH